MIINGFVICQPVNTWGNKTIPPWHPFTSTFGKTPLQAWINFLMSGHKVDYGHSRWYEMQNHYINRGYCVKETNMDVKI